ncbi:MAG TPA: SH3 domain-containing protein [Polyangiaceae bacterium]|nr:SH3 domain-containing protein [Polyangiaceae bacterium]
MSERSASSAVLAACVALSLPALARADDTGADGGAVDVDAVARVTSSSSELRAGPGLAYRVIHRAERGDTFPIQGREGTGFWLRVYLPDGRTAYLLGDTADTLLLGELDGAAAGAPGVFAPPPLASANGGLAMTGGVFDANGYAEIKPAFVVNASLSLEPYVGLVMSASGRSLLYGAGATLNLAPDWALAPYVSIGAGGFSNLPNDDQFALSERNLLHARAGGGLLVSLRWRIILRVEATNTVLFDADSYDNVQSYVAGLGSYF